MSSESVHVPIHYLYVKDMGNWTLVIVLYLAFKRTACSISFNFLDCTPYNPDISKNPFSFYLISGLLTKLYSVFAFHVTIHKIHGYYYVVKSTALITKGNNYTQQIKAELHTGQNNAKYIQQQ